MIKQRFGLLLGLLFALGGALTIVTGRLRSATVAEFALNGRPAQFVGLLFTIMGVMLLVDWFKKR